MKTVSRKVRCKITIATFISKVIIVGCLLLPVTVQAGALAEYEEAHKLYLTAIACMAAYSDRIGDLRWMNWRRRAGR